MAASAATVLELPVRREFIRRTPMGSRKTFAGLRESEARFAAGLAQALILALIIAFISMIATAGGIKGFAGAD
jgi:hypothetical protein